MPIFRTTKNIFVDEDGSDFFDENWMDSDTLILPPNPMWDYSRELNIEDVSLWEVIYEGYNNTALYASWEPYAEFYLLIINDYWTANKEVETFYGKGAQKRLLDRLKELNVYLNLNKLWVEEENMYLYE